MVVWDSDGCFRPETPTRVVAPSWARFVRLSVQLEVSAAMNSRRELTIRRNGSAEYPGRTVMRGCGNGTDWNVPPNAVTPWLPVTAGDWFDAHLGQTSNLAFELLASGGTWMQAEFA